MKVILSALLGIFIAINCMAATPYRTVGPFNNVELDRYDDPGVPNVSCYVSREVIGGEHTYSGLSRNGSLFSVTCVATGPVSVPANLPETQQIFTHSSSPLFKFVKIYRINDPQKHTLVYIAISGQSNKVSVVVY